MAYYIGIDLGTSSVKLIIMSADGTIVKSTSKEYPIYFPGEGMSEQNPDDWYNAVISGIGELTDGIDKKEIKGISFGGQMHGLVMLDKYDRVIRPAILWNDGRTQKQCDHLNGTVGMDKLTEYTANIAFPGFTAPKILWLKENEPENFARINKIMLPKDYITYKLTGVHSTDMSDASGTLLFDVKNRCWSSEMLEICGIDERVMPALHESSSVTGTLAPHIADKLCLGRDTRIIAGAGDNAAAAIGTGTVKDGSCNISLGTSGTIFISCDSFFGGSGSALHSFAHANGRYHLMGCILSAASCNKWWQEDILGKTDLAAAQKNIKALGDNSVFFLPYLMGERSPHNDPFARSAFIGMSMSTTADNMLQAVMEGVAFAIRDCMEAANAMGIEVKRSSICGGGAKSPLWCRIMANVLNIPLCTLENEEGPAFGAAMLAAVGCGEFKDTSEAAEKLVKERLTYYPDKETAEKYNNGYLRFKKLYPTLKDWFRAN